VSAIGSAFRPPRKALVAYVTAGYPSMAATLEVVPRLAELGCDIVEMGIPFSDPLADGATIQKASYESLKNGTTPEACLEMAAEVHRKTPAPLVFMTYYNPVFSYGVSKFAAGCAAAGVSGLIVPDLPPEESTALDEATLKHGIDLIDLLAPTSTPERVALVAAHSRGFIYLVSVTGVTGARRELSPDLEPFVRRVRAVARQPLCVGFGISTPEQARQVGSMADGVIVGSRLVQLMEAPDWQDGVCSFVTSLRRALDA
jgi:tryptophan synthase alpha chain